MIQLFAKNRFLRLMLLTAAWLMVHVAQAQTIYPIRSIATLSGTAPYTLNGFVSQEGKLQVYLFIDDAAINQHAVKLRLTLQSSDVKISTTAAYKAAPLFLDGGTMQTLTSLDLAPLFSLNNLNFEGYTKAQYQKTGRLPEGVYRISVDVLDYYRNVVISKSTAAIGMMYLTKAPLLTFPVDKSEVDLLTSPQIRFSWMTYQAANPAAEVVHRFRLWEVKPAGRNANEVVTVMNPIYEEEVTGASVIINPDQLLLNQGSWYVWQVQAVDLQNQVIYQNSGKSQVMTFRYGKSCNTPDPRIVKVTNTGADIAWDANLTTRQYKVNYRLTGATEWTTDITTLPTYSFKQLTDNSTYECTVTALCSSEESEPSEVLQFKTNRTVNYACGTGEGKFDLSNTQPLASLNRFDEFKAADFIVEANEVTGSDGTFSGTGYVLVPYLSFMKMMVTFKNITINSDHRMISGQIEFVYDVATGMVGTVYRDKTTTAGAAEQLLAEGGDKVITTTQPITNVIVNNNTVTITLQDGTTQTVTVDKKGDTVAIVSSDGKTAYVADTGSGMVFTTPVPGSSEASNSSTVATPAQSGIYGCSVDIKPIVDPSGGFDPVGNGINKPNNYFLSSKAGKPIAWKSIPAGGTDYVQVEVKGDCAIDSLRYLRASGLPVPSTPAGRGNRLLLTGTSDGDEEVLTVALSTKKLQPDSTYSQTLTEAGALGLVSYEPLQRDVYIVPVNGAVTPAYAPAIKAVLDKLYAPAQVSWNVTIKANIQVDNITADGFKTADLTLGSRYTSDMNKVIKAWKKANNLPAKTVVLFFVKASNSDKLGYMPLTGNYGFIFNLGSNLELLAHELAHGTFNLKHTFSDDSYWRESGKAPIFAEKTTQNLMDYANGTELWKYQWDLIHKPESVVLGSLDEDEGAMENSVFQDILEDVNIIDTENKNVAYYTPSGKIIILPSSVIPNFKNSTNIPVPEGALVGFKYESNQYVAKYSKRNESWYFDGYYTPASFLGISFEDQYEAEYSEETMKLKISTNTSIQSENSFAIIVGVTETGSAVYARVVTAASELFEGLGLSVGATVTTGALALVIIPGDTRIKGFTGAGTLVDVLPLLPFTAKDYVEPQAIPKPIAIPHAIPKGSGGCNVYVIFKVDGDQFEIAKFGQTCQSDCDKRPDLQCRRFSQEENCDCYRWTWLIEGVPVEVALLFEKSLTAAYVIANDGRLPPRHKLPCFIKGDSDKFEKRVDLAKKWLDDMIKQYGKYK